MNKQLPYEDMLLTCINCDNPFDYPATEQDYFARLSLAPPKRCRRCRQNKQSFEKRTPFIQQQNLNYRPLHQIKLKPTKVSTVNVNQRLDYSDRQESELELRRSEPAPIGSPNRVIAQLKAENIKLREELNELRAEVETIKLNFVSTKTSAPKLNPARVKA